MLTDTINTEHPLSTKTFNIYHYEISSDKSIKALKGKDLPSYAFLIAPMPADKNFYQISIYDTDIAFKNIPQLSPELFIGALWYITTRKRCAYLFSNNHIDIYVGEDDHGLVSHLKENKFTVNEYKDNS